jgi:hypothetical protein
MSAPDIPDDWMVPINRLVAAVETRYRTTPATAIECLKQLDDGLMALGMEPDCCGLWQVLVPMAEDENEWDGLSAVEQAGKDVPKGKTRKSTGQA